MSSFSETLKYVNRTPARVATDADLQGSPSLVDPLKYTKRTKSRKVDKIPLVFYVPNTISSLIGVVSNGRYIVFQYGYSFAQNFYIAKKPLFIQFLDELKNCDLCIRYRIDDTAYRYQLNAFNTGQSGLPLNLNFAPLYTNQLIKKNFVIECWVQFDTPGVFDTVEINNLESSLGFRFETSLRQEPSTSDQLEVIGSASTFIQDELYVTLPEDIPTDYNPLGPWLNNV